jgi:hypothetical protein
MANEFLSRHFFNTLPPKNSKQKTTFKLREKTLNFKIFRSPRLIGFVAKTIHHKYHLEAYLPHASLLDDMKKERRS